MIENHRIKYLCIIKKIIYFSYMLYIFYYIFIFFIIYYKIYHEYITIYKILYIMYLNYNIIKFNHQYLIFFKTNANECYTI